MNKKRILSIDGGGIRGIIPGVIIAYLEDCLQKKTNNIDARICDYFDMIAGTSTGGILTCCYLFPDKKYSAKQAVEMYLARGTEIFSKSFFYKLKSIGGLNSAKYSATNIEKIFTEYFGKAKLSDLVKPCVITSYDITRRKIKIFNSIDAILTPIDDYLVKDICRVTSAAPTYFPPAKIKSMYGDPLNGVDGGMFANNPAMCAFAEAKEHFKDDDLFILSIGTGSEAKSYDIKKAESWGLIGWVAPVIDILMSSNAEAVHYAMTKLETDYIHLSPSLCTASHEMDDASPDNLAALLDAGKTFVAENMTTLNSIVDLLTDEVL